MPELKASGDVFNANGQAGFDEGIVSGKVGGGARLSVAAELDFCHGLNAQLSAQAMAEAEANLHLLWVLLGKAQGQALASAGAQLTGQLNGSLFETFGLSAEAAIYAQASLAGSLALGLTVEEIAQLARGMLDDLAYDLFIAFLNETSLEFGVWGKIGVAAMAHAHLNIRGSLSDDDNAGFLVEAGAEAGWGGGGGYDFYGGVRLDQPKRFFSYASERITREMVTYARSQLPPDFRPAAAVLEFTLPLALNAAYELGQAAVFDALGSPDKLTGKFNGAFVAQLQKFALDRLTETGLNLIKGYLQSAINGIFDRDIPLQQLEDMHDQALALAERFKKGEFTLADLNQALTGLMDLLTTLYPNEVEDWRRPISMAWVALAAAEAVRAGVQSLSASASIDVVGVNGGSVGGGAFTLPDPPALVRDELAAFFNVMPPSLELRHAVDYLDGVGVEPLIRAALPELALFLDSLSAQTGITPGDILSTALKGTLTQDISQTDLYQKLRDFVKGHIDGVISQELLPELRAEAHRANNTLLVKWLDEVAGPSMLLLSGFAFERLDAAVAGTLTGDLSPFTSTFRTAFSSMVGRIVTLNVVIISDITLNFAIQGLHDGFRLLENVVRSDPTNAIAAAAPLFFRQIVPAGQLLPPSYNQAALELTGDLLHAAADGFGPAVWTRQRKGELLNLWKQALQSIDGQLDFSDGQAVANFFAAVAECSFIPNEQCVEDLLRLEVQIVAASLEASLPQVNDALTVFALKVTLSAVEELEALARAFLEDLRAALNQLWDELQAAIRLFNQRVAEFQAAAREAADTLRAAKSVLKKPARRAEILDRLLLVGITRAQENVRNTPGFDLQPANLQADELSAAAGAFTLAFNLARPVFDACLAVLAPLADELADLLDAAADLPDLIARMVAAAGVLITQAANDALGVFGLSLPKELSIDDIIDAVEWMLDNLSVVKDALRAAITAAEQKKLSDQRKQLAQQRKAQAEQAYQAGTANSRDLSVSSLNVNIISPLPFLRSANHRTEDWSYGREVPVVIEVRGATQAFLDPSHPDRIFLALNGAPVPLERAKWRYDSAASGLVFETVYGPTSAGLKPGMNILECSVVTGQGKVYRQSVAFVTNPELAAPAALLVDSLLSVFNAPGNDHRSLRQEKIVLQNNGTVPLALTGWRMFDLKDHLFLFPAFQLGAGRSVSIHTGSGQNSRSHLYMDRGAAVWNNTGDTLHLVDERGILASFYTYRKA